VAPEAPPASLKFWAQASRVDNRRRSRRRAYARVGVPLQLFHQVCGQMRRVDSQMSAALKLRDRVLGRLIEATGRAAWSEVSLTFTHARAANLFSCRRAPARSKPPERRRAAGSSLEGIGRPGRPRSPPRRFREGHVRRGRRACRQPCETNVCFFAAVDAEADQSHDCLPRKMSGPQPSPARDSS